MNRISLRILVYLVFLCLWGVSVGAAQIQLFGIRSIDGILSLEYQALEQGTSETVITSTTELEQKYELSMDTFIIHPKFISWGIDGDFGIRKRDDVTELTNTAYGTNIRILRDYFISSGLSYHVGQDEIAQSYAPSFTRDRVEQSADFSIRLRHFPTSFSYRKIDLTSTAVGHEEDSSETRLGLATNMRLRSGINGTLRLNHVEKADTLKPADTDIKYLDASLTNSWSSQDRKVSWNSSVRSYQKQSPTESGNVSVSESLNYNGEKLGTGIRLSLSQNDEGTTDETRLGGTWNTTYKFSDLLRSRLELGINRLEYARPTSTDYLQDRYNLKGQLDYRVQKEKNTYFATATAGYVQRNVEGEGEYSTSEVARFDLITREIWLKNPGVTGVITVRNYEDPEIVYYETAWDYDIDSDGYAVVYITETEPGDDPKAFIPEGTEVHITYTYVPQQDGKELNGDVKVGLQRSLGSNVTLTTHVAGNARKDILHEDEELDFGHELYLGARADLNRLTFSGSISNDEDGNSIATEARYEQGAFTVSGRYGADFTPQVDPRHNLSLNGRYSTYLPIGVRLTLTANEKIVYRSGEMIDGDFSLTTSARYALRRYMWLKDEFKMSLNHMYDNGLRWSNLIGFEWKQGLLSLDSGYELVGNETTDYRSSRFTVKLSRRF